MIIYDYFHDYSKNKISQSERKAQSEDCIELLMLLYTGSYEPLCHAFYIGSTASRPWKAVAFYTYIVSGLLSHIAAHCSGI